MENLLYIFFILGAAIAAAYSMMMLHIISGITKLNYYVKGKAADLPSISVIIAARNEAENVASCIESIYKSGLPGSTEVIVADDHSTDQTAAIVKECAARYTGLRLLSMEPGKEGKKAAITSAVLSAKGDLLVFTDADCIVPPGWVSDIAHFHREHGCSMIIMPVHLAGNGLQALEFFSLTTVTAATAMNGNPLMCNGAALAYEKWIFLKHGGFKGNEQTPSGDDMFLLQKVKKQGRVGYLAVEGKAVLTPPAGTFGAFFDQRVRWASKTKYYSDKSATGAAILVVLMPVFPLLTGISGLLLSSPTLLWTALVLFVFKAFIDFLCLLLAAKFFNRTRLLIWFLPGQLLYPFYVIAAGASAVTGAYNWKGRRYTRQYENGIAQKR